MGIALYLHIPFCIQKCRYCDFNSYAGYGPEEQQRYVDALLREMALWAARPEMAGTPVSTLYIGGGTPTALDGALLERLIRAVGEYFALEPGAEVTLEANPGTVDIQGEKLHRAFAAGANRISFGVQARQEYLLRRLGRIHTAAEVEKAVAAAREAGFTNINLDLMYGLPEQTPAEFRETLHWALSLEPTHISAYSLIVEEGTPFFAAQQAGRLPLPPEEAEEEMAADAVRILGAAGLEQYEVSNFARPGFRCRHNLVYWRNEPYLGLGCGAHSFLTLQAPLDNLGPAGPHLSASRVQGDSHVATAPGRPGDHYRFWNLRTPAAYQAALEAGRLPVEAGEALDEAGEMAETMIMGLRMVEGVSEARFAARFGRSVTSVYGQVLERLERQGLLVRQDGAVRLTPRGMRLGNRVWMEFLPD
ncbi:MAG TPA: radical SAM family heme chaperone HemW [Symbiobacteriaceae bacterium]